MQSTLSQNNKSRAKSHLSQLYRPKDAEVVGPIISARPLKKNRWMLEDAGDCKLNCVVATSAAAMPDVVFLLQQINKAWST